MNELSLFTGAGGGLLGTHGLLGWRCRGYVEFNDYCHRVIRQRIADGILDEAPIFGDIRTFISDGYARRYRGMVDVVSGGFPCQPFSVAGKQLADNDPRDMWPSTIAVIRELRPRFAFLENVPGLLTGSHGYFGRILGDLAEAGYDARWCVLSAADVGAPHKRARLWVLGYSAVSGLSERGCDGFEAGEGEGGAGVDSGLERPGTLADTGHPEPSGRLSVAQGSEGESRGEPSPQGTHRGEQGQMAESGESGLQGSECPGGLDLERWEVAHGSVAECGGAWWAIDPADIPYTDDEPRPQASQTTCPFRGERNARDDVGGCDWGCAPGKCWWAAQPRLDRVVNGVANRVDRLKAIGNGQVPLVAAVAWEMLSGELR